MRKITLALCLLPYNLFACQQCVDYVSVKLNSAYEEWHRIFETPYFEPYIFYFYHGRCLAYQDMKNNIHNSGCQDYSNIKSKEALSLIEREVEDYLPNKMYFFTLLGNLNAYQDIKIKLESMHPE